jgi:GNAT superfamily N-acetyltransferase
MDREESQRLNLIALREFYARVGRNAPDAQLIVRNGLIATVNPGARKASLFNSVIYEEPGAIERELAELALAYDRAGVLAWAVWVPDDDVASKELLAAAGHVLDTSPRMMGVRLADLDFSDHNMDGITWTREGSSDAINEINDAAYGLPPGLCERGFGLLSPDHFNLYVAEHEGEPGACVVSFDYDGDCGVWAVATVPEARNRGLSKALMRQALLDAREAGSQTSTLQASVLGKPVYDTVGYEDHGAFEMWERRREE